jgi:hypothetical protein
MKRVLHWQVIFGAALVSLSAALYFLHYLVFRDSHHIFLYLLGDIAFIPIDVLIVTLIIDNILRVREKKALLNKMNMLVGAFYSEIGSELLGIFCAMDPSSAELRGILKVSADWSEDKFRKIELFLKGHKYGVSLKGSDIAPLKELLGSKRDFLLNLLANPNLLEHEAFTDVLWAVFHLTDELIKRKDVLAVPEKDREHIAGDIRRAYKAITLEWLEYMGHLRVSYPYLFSLAVRTNPFDPEAEVVVG